MSERKIISDEILSTKFYDRTDDSLKDEDNVAWVMKLKEEEIKEWVTVLKWVRVADRLLERDMLQKQNNENTYTFQNFLSDWRMLRTSQVVDKNSNFASLFLELKKRWERERLSEEELKVWDLYLDSIVKYVKPNTVIPDMKEYENALYGLSGTFFRAFPFAPTGYNREIGILGTLDQFYNNLRDLYEDTVRGICYLPESLLERFGIQRKE